MNIYLFLALLFIACVITMGLGIYLTERTNRKLKSGQLTDKDMEKEYQQYLKKLREPTSESKAEETIELHFAAKNKEAIKISPEVQKRVVSVRTGSKTPQLNRKTKQK